MPDKLILLMYESSAGLDRAVSGLTHEEATARHDGGICITRTLGHVSHMVDSWINVSFQRLPPHPVISHPRFRTGESGEATDWPVVLSAVREIREVGKRFLDSPQEPDLDRVIPYGGSIAFLRPLPVPTLRPNADCRASLHTHGRGRDHPLSPGPCP